MANGIRTHSSLKGLRKCIRPEFAAMPAAELEQIVNSSISSLPQDAAEDFLDRLRSLGKAVAPTLEHAAPGIAQAAGSAMIFSPYPVDQTGCRHVCSEGRQGTDEGSRESDQQDDAPALDPYRGSGWP